MRKKSREGDKKSKCHNSILFFLPKTYMKKLTGRKPKDGKKKNALQGKPTIAHNMEKNGLPGNFFKY